MTSLKINSKETELYTPKIGEEERGERREVKQIVF